MPKTFIMVRGLPGSGKSTLAKKLATLNDSFHIEADMFFVDLQGNYIFDPQKIGDAHEWCFRGFSRDIENSRSVIVSNTFTRMNEMEKYLDLAKDNNYNIWIISCYSQYGSIHGVPEETMKKMAARFVSNDQIKSCFSYEKVYYLNVT